MPLTRTPTPGAPRPTGQRWGEGNKLRRRGSLAAGAGKEGAGDHLTTESVMQLDMWDYLTFATFIVIGIGFTIVFIFMLGLPGRIALARKHPEAEAVSLMGYLGFLAVVPWIQAFLWAFKPTDVVDVRRMPAEEARAIQEEIARLEGKEPAKPTPQPTPPAPHAGHQG